MPERIAQVVAQEDSTNSTSGVIINLANLLQRDPNVELAYLCTKSAVQVSKLSNEGAHFCGYRNLQMLLLALAGNGVSGSTVEMKSTIPELQHMIEHAWEEGYNAHGKTLTGGIKGTRKHVGTSEAEALLLSLAIPCTGRAYQGTDAWNRLLDGIEAYFASSKTRTRPPGQKVIQTNLPPIFLQRPKHSLTVVGLQRNKAGKRCLLTFDPAWQPPSKMAAPLDEMHCSGWSASWLLRQYRKSEHYLKRFNAFETLEAEVDE